MRDLTEDKPKCLIPVKGKPLLERQIQVLKQAGIQNIGLVTGYLSERLRPYGLEIFHNERWADTKIVSSLTRAALWLKDEETLVSYSDILYTPDTVRRLCLSDADIAITYDPFWLQLWQARFEDPLLDAETFKTDERGRVKEIGARSSSLSEIQGQYMGLLKIKPAGWKKIENYLVTLFSTQIAEMDMTSLLSRLVQSGVDVYAVPIRDRWFEIDSERDLELCESWMKSCESP